MVHDFTDKNFQTEVLNANVPVLIDFWAVWCAPCRVQGPIVDEVAKDFEGKGVKIGKLNVDESPETAEKYGILGIPTLLIFKNGQVAEKLVGVHDKQAITEYLNRVI